MSGKTKVGVGLAVLVMVLVALTAGPPALRRNAERRTLLRDLDRIARLEVSAMQMVSDRTRGFAPVSYPEQMAGIASQARAESKRLSEIARQRRSAAYQDLEGWAQALAEYADAARRLGPPKGAPGYVDWDAKMEPLKSRLEQVSARAFDPTTSQVFLKSAQEEVEVMRRVGYSEAEVAGRYQELVRRARQYSHDSPEGKAALAEASRLESQIAALEATRAFTIVETKPYLEGLHKAGDLAQRTVAMELEYGPRR